VTHEQEFPTRRFFRDPKHGIFGGVCAGIANYFGFDVTAVRIITFCCMLFFQTLILVYILLVFIVPRQPNTPERTAAERAFDRAIRRAPKATFAEVRYRFRDLEARLQKMERYVTSKRFQLDREFDKLRDQE
jgi:phage shock protein C